MKLPERLIEPTGRRRRAYSMLGILRMACWRCGRRAAYQWWHRSCAQAFARPEWAAGHWRPLCVPCDIEQNRNVLAFYGDDDLDDMIAAYTLEAWRIAHDGTAGLYCAEFPGECHLCP